MISGKLSDVRVRALLPLLLVAGVAAVILMMPPRAQPIVDAGWTSQRHVVRGAYHVHSQRSDGSGTVDAIAAAAAGVGLDFVILTDHGDGTRPPDPPAYRSGVLCIDGVEISTSGGHYVALGLPTAPYPLGGSAGAVVEDVARLGGFGIAAHPDSAKPELRWSEWRTGFDGVEWLNADSEWRDESYAGLARLLLTYWFRPVETLAAALDRPAATIERWDALTARRRVPAVAGADAHARIGLANRTDPYQERAVARIPSYAVSFQTFQNHVVLDAPFTREAAADGARLLAAIREGHLFTTLDGAARSGGFELVGRSGEATAQEGEYLELRGSATIEARVAAPAGATMVLMRDGMPIHETTAPRLRVDIGGADVGAYRVEVRLAGRPPVPWLLSNPIYAGLRERHQRLAAAAPAATATEAHDVALGAVQAESDPRSTSTPTAPEPGDATSPMSWTFALADGVRAGQYAAARVPVSGLTGADRIVLRVRAERPMRAWVQLRAPSSLPGDGERWGASFYADDTEREVTLAMEAFAPIGVTATRTPVLERVDSILFVADTINSQPGTGNTLRLSRVAVGR